MIDPPSLQAATRGADYVEEKRIRSEATLPEFLAGLFSYSPPWLRALYRVRVGFLAMLGHRETGVPNFGAPRRVPLRAGERLSFFRVEDASDGHYWIAVASEAHLSARLAVLREPTGQGDALYRVVTVVHLHNFAGRVYFTTILPFHHLVVNAMMRFAARGAA